MPRAKLIRTSDFPYHITVRSNNREWFDLPMDKLWEIFSEYLYLTNKIFALEIHAFVLMNNHLHLIARTPQANIDKAMRFFLKDTSERISRSSHRVNHLYGGPYHSSVICEPNYYLAAYKYVLQNPLEAGLCTRVEDYKYSTLYGLLGRAHLLIPTVGNDELFEDTADVLKWLNTQPSQLQRDELRKAFKRHEFKLREKVCDTFYERGASPKSM